MVVVCSIFLLEFLDKHSALSLPSLSSLSSSSLFFIYSSEKKSLTKRGKAFFYTSRFLTVVSSGKLKRRGGVLGQEEYDSPPSYVIIDGYGQRLLVITVERGLLSTIQMGARRNWLRVLFLNR